MVGHVWDASLAALRPTLMRSKLIAAKPLAPEIVHRKPAVAGSPRATTWAYNFDSGSVPRVSFEMRSMPCRELRGELACSNRLPRRMPSGPVSYSSTAQRSAWEQALCMAGVLAGTSTRTSRSARSMGAFPARQPPPSATATPPSAPSGARRDAAECARAAAARSRCEAGAREPVGARRCRQRRSCRARAGTHDAVPLVACSRR